MGVYGGVVSCVGSLGLWGVRSVGFEERGECGVGFGREAGISNVVD